jgi:hypothetical protein
MLEGEFWLRPRLALQGMFSDPSKHARSGWRRDRNGYPSAIDLLDELSFDCDRVDGRSCRE